MPSKHFEMFDTPSKSFDTFAMPSTTFDMLSRSSMKPPNSCSESNWHFANVECPLLPKSSPRHVLCHLHASWFFRRLSFLASYSSPGWFNLSLVHWQMDPEPSNLVLWLSVLASSCLSHCSAPGHPLLLWWPRDHCVWPCGWGGDTIWLLCLHIRLLYVSSSVLLGSTSSPILFGVTQPSHSTQDCLSQFCAAAGRLHDAKKFILTNSVFKEPPSRSAPDFPFGKLSKGSCKWRFQEKKPKCLLHLLDVLEWHPGG